LAALQPSVKSLPPRGCGLPPAGKALSWPNSGEPRVWPGGSRPGLPLD
jgi:hypothetical protein